MPTLVFRDYLSLECEPRWWTRSYQNRSERRAHMTKSLYKHLEHSSGLEQRLEAYKCYV